MPFGNNCAAGGVKIETGLDSNRNSILDATEINTSQTRFICNGLDGASGGGGGTGTMAYATGSGPNPSPNLAFLAPVATVSVSQGQQVLVISTRVLGTNSPAGAGDLELAMCFQGSEGGLVIVSGSQLHDLGINHFDRIPFSISAVISNLGGGTYQVGLCGYSSSTSTSNAWNYNEGGSTSALVSGEVTDDRRVSGSTLTIGPSVAGWQVTPGSTAVQTADLTIGNNGDEKLTWTAEENVPWLTLSATSGETSMTITLKADPTGQEPNTMRQTTIRFTGTASGQAAQIVDVPVTLAVTSTTPEVNSSNVYLPTVRQ